MRRTGKTTRKVDTAIQDLFSKGIAYLYEGRVSRKEVHDEAMEIFNSRVILEHPHTKYSYEFGKFDGVWCYKIELHEL